MKFIIPTSAALLLAAMTPAALFIAPSYAEDAPAAQQAGAKGKQLPLGEVKTMDDAIAYATKEGGENWTAIAKALTAVKGGADINKTPVDGQSEETILSCICSNSRVDDLVAFLLTQKADPNAVIDPNSRSAMTALGSACGAYPINLDIIAGLIYAGADLNKQYGYEHLTPLITVADAQKLDAIKLLVDAGADVNAPDGQGWPVLAHVLKVQDASGAEKALEAAKYLIENGKAKVDYVNPTDGSSIMMHAATSLTLPIVDYLVSKGAKLDQADRDGETVPFYLCKAGLPDKALATLKELEPRLDFKKVNNNGENLLFPVANAKNTAKAAPMVAYLVSKGVSVKATDKRKTQTALHVAAASIMPDGPEVAESLLKAGADINALDTFGNTPLLRAVADGKPMMVAFLLKQGAKTTIKNKSGKGVWDLATRPEVKKALEDAKVPQK